MTPKGHFEINWPLILEKSYCQKKNLAVYAWKHSPEIVISRLMFYMFIVMTEDIFAKSVEVVSMYHHIYKNI